MSLSPTFCKQLFGIGFVQLFSTYSLALYFFGKRILTKYVTQKLLVKLSTSVNFTNILQASFLELKCSAQLLYLFLYCLCLHFLQKNIDKKAARKMLVKLSTSANFTNISQTSFWSKSVLRSFYMFYICFCKRKMTKSSS